MIFKRMSLERAKEFYKELKEASANAGSVPLLKIAMDDLWFFTEGLTKNYGRLRNKTNINDGSKYIQISMDIGGKDEICKNI